MSDDLVGLSAHKVEDQSESTYLDNQYNEFTLDMLTMNDTLSLSLLVSIMFNICLESGK